MTDIDTRLRSELPLVAEAMLTESLRTSPTQQQEEEESPRFGRVLAAVALLAVTLGAGFLLRAYTSPPAEFIETASQVSRVEGLDDEFMWMATSAMNPAIPQDSTVQLFELSDDVVLQRGDLVVANSRRQPDTEVLRRIVGLPGETVESDNEWELKPSGDPSQVTGQSEDNITSNSIDFGYVVVADNPSFSDEGFERYSHDEIRLWAPADTSAVPPLLPSERADLESSLQRCLEATELDTADIDFSTRQVFDDLFAEVDQQGVSEASFRTVAECTRAHAALSR